MTNRGKRAVVLGASMTGLTAARVLANHFDQVTLVERDRLPADNPTESRKGVPQGNHGHALLAKGYRVLEGYFPGLMDELVSAGGNHGDATGDFLWYQFGGWKLRSDSGVQGIIVSRPLLEARVRARVRNAGNVSFAENCDGVEPVFTASEARVQGLLVKDRETGAERTLEADLVVDASGRGSKSPDWLSKWGFGQVEQSLIEVHFGYATAQFERRPGDIYGTLGAAVTGTPPNSKRGAFALAVEHSRWTVTLGAWLRDYPPTDLAGFREFARSLPSSAIFDVTKDRQPLTPIYQYRFPANRRCHYEKLARLPSGFLVLGDAFCSFNPIYGQGMTVGIQQAQLLDELLKTGTQGLARRFFDGAARIAATPWDIATGEDFRFPEVNGPRPPGLALTHRYLARVHRAAQKDPVVLRRFLEVAHLLKSPAAIMAPDVAWRVLWGGRGRRQVTPTAKV